MSLSQLQDVATCSLGSDFDRARATRVGIQSPDSTDAAPRIAGAISPLCRRSRITHRIKFIKFSIAIRVMTIRRGVT